jgi:hypothetical protein
MILLFEMARMNSNVLWVAVGPDGKIDRLCGWSFPVYV